MNNERIGRLKICINLCRRSSANDKRKDKQINGRPKYKKQTATPKAASTDNKLKALIRKRHRILQIGRPFRIKRRQEKRISFSSSSNTKQNDYQTNY